MGLWLTIVGTMLTDRLLVRERLANFDVLHCCKHLSNMQAKCVQACRAHAAHLMHCTNTSMLVLMH